MQAYDFLDLDGTTIHTTRAQSANLACLNFVREKMYFQEQMSEGAQPDDVICVLSGKVVAIISDRGNRTPDIMVIDQMRQRVLQQAG